MFLPSNTPISIMLVGISGCGKTTWAEKFSSSITQGYYTRISSDKFIEQKAKNEGTTYDKVFNGFIGEATKKMYAELEAAVRDKKNIIWDQTNVSPSSRLFKLKLIPNDYYKVALVWEPLHKYLNHKTERPDKHISKEVILEMVNRYSQPTLQEGFNQIIIHDGSV